MKKLALTSLLVFLAVSGAHAATMTESAGDVAKDYFVGGGIAIATDSEHASLFSVAPEFGWKYDEKWDFGVMAKFGHEHKYLPDNYGMDGEAYAYGVGAFARYKLAEFGDAKLLLKGSVGMDFVTLSPEDDAIDAETMVSINASVVPMVTYDVSDSFTLFANLNFLGMSAGYSFENKDLGVADSWRFGAAVDANNVVNTGDFQIGFYYNF